MSREHLWLDPRKNVARRYWVMREAAGRTLYSFNLMTWHRTFRAAAEAPVEI